MPERTPRLLELCCGAGGAAKGYQRRGFYVVGVDIEPQPNYCGDEFIQADVLEFLRDPDNVVGFDAYHASPPCQWATDYRRKGYGVGEGYPNLIPTIRSALRYLGAGAPYVIENVRGAREYLHDPVTYCGSSFGLDVRRHRLFESNIKLAPPPCDHAWQTPRFPAATNRAAMSRRTVEVGAWRIPLDVQQRAMGIDWMTLPELSEAIPPAYTEHIGGYLMAALITEGLAA